MLRPGRAEVPATRPVLAADIEIITTVATAVIRTRWIDPQWGDQRRYMLHWSMLPRPSEREMRRWAEALISDAIEKLNRHYCWHRQIG